MGPALCRIGVSDRTWPMLHSLRVAIQYLKNGALRVSPETDIERLAPQPQIDQGHVRSQSGNAGSTYNLPAGASCCRPSMACKSMKGAPAAQA